MNLKIKGVNYISILISILFLILIFVLIRTAWVCDDAYISFRTVKNFLSGYGLTWNISERVQVYTSPFMLFIMIIVSFFTKEVYFTSIFINIFCTLLAIILIIKELTYKNNIIPIILSLLIFSKAFIDFSTSGLENSLLYLLITIFYIQFFNKNKTDCEVFKKEDYKLLKLSLISSFIMLTRMDGILLILPALVYQFKKSQYTILKRFKAIIIGFLPFIIWEMFSLFYYGFLFPNTAYAKLNTGTSYLCKLKNGLNYIFISFSMDIASLLIILQPLIQSIKNYKQIFIKDNCIILSIVLYIIYIIYIGGDFMRGRFISTLIIISVIFTVHRSTVKFSKFITISLVILIFLIGINIPRNNLLSNINYNDSNFYSPSQIADERGFYYKHTGLLKALKRENICIDADGGGKRERWKNRNIELLSDSIKKTIISKDTPSNKRLLIAWQIGFLGYYEEPSTYILDKLALADPLLSRISTINNNICPRPGHIERPIPKGYIETLLTGENYIEDKRIGSYNELLRSVIKDKLFSIDRIKNIIKINLKKNIT